MLVLSRKCDESVVLGGSSGCAHLAKVTVLEIGPGKVRLGFEANKDVLVYREEVWTQMRTSRLDDLTTGGSDRTGSGNADEKATVLSGG